MVREVRTQHLKQQRERDHAEQRAEQAARAAQRAEFRATMQNVGRVWRAHVDSLPRRHIGWFVQIKAERLPFRARAVVA